jgi:hypothetical protein
LLFAFKWTSNQRAIAATKRQIHAGLFELRLFQDDPRLMLRAAGGLLWQQGRYLRHALVPLLWVSVPLSLLLAHLHAYYGYEGLRPGHSTIVTVRMTEGGAATATPLPLTLAAPPGLRVETPCVWVPSQREGAWRIAADRGVNVDGDYDLRVTWNQPPNQPNQPPTEPPTRTATLTKRVHVGDTLVARAPVRPAASVWDEWLHPAEPPLPPDAPIDAITVTYPERAIDVIGLACPWPVVFFALTTAFMLLGRSLLQIVI